MTRIVAGVASGAKLQVPNGPTRPTSERVREAMFSTLDSFGVLSGATVLDAYAGSGALGLEAASRGAQSVTLVDASRQATASCMRNIEAISARGVTTRFSVENSEINKWLRRQAASPTFDLVFFDPPYALTNQQLGETLELMRSILLQDTMVVIERGARTPDPELPTQFEVAKTKKYGDTKVWYTWFGIQ